MAFIIIITISLSGAIKVLASSTSNFTQEITAGTIAADIVDASYVTVGSPSVAMSNTPFSFSCQTITGTFGTNSQRVYVTNPDAADSGWSLTLAASSATDVWDSAGTDFDFNDPTGSGCTDGADADLLGGQMTINPSAGTVAQGASAHGTTGISKGSSSAFSQGVTDSITIMTSDGTTDIGDWYITGVEVSQKIPAEQPAAADYDINMVLTATAT